jgi:hypothetical protein
MLSPLYTHNGLILKVQNALAAGPECCCETPTPTPTEIYTQTPSPGWILFTEPGIDPLCQNAYDQCNNNAG